jgi:hypothetical protein
LGEQIDDERYVLLLVFAERAPPVGELVGPFDLPGTSPRYNLLAIVVKGYIHPDRWKRKKHKG